MPDKTKTPFSIFGGRAICRLPLILLLLTFGANGHCGIWQKWTVSRPADFNLVKALLGHTLIVEKGIFFDTKWSIQKDDISNLKVTDSSALSPEGIYFVTVKFQLIREGKGLRVEGVMRFNTIGNNSSLLDFTPTKIEKFGNW